MIRIISLLALIGFSQLSISFTLEGTWQEDKDRTLLWNSTHRKVDDKHIENMSKIMGNLFFTYKKDKFCMYSKPYEIDNNGKTHKVSAYIPEVGSYEVLAKNDYGYVVKAIYTAGTEQIWMAIFESGESMYGVTLSTEDYGQPGSRVYFRKVAPVKWESVCKY